MKKSGTMIVAVVVGLSTVGGLAWAGAKAKSAPVLMPADQVKFTDVPGFPGVQMAAVEGDPSKGPHHFFLKYAGGFSAPVHHHTANHYVAVVSGTLVLTVDGTDHRLTPGSYFAFIGQTPHATKCEAGADCVIFSDVRSKWDVVPEKQHAEAK